MSCVKRTHPVADPLLTPVEKNFGAEGFRQEDVYIHREPLQMDDEFLILMSAPPLSL